jgi:hypothetical protein
MAAWTVRKSFYESYLRLSLKKEKSCDEWNHVNKPHWLFVCSMVPYKLIPTQQVKGSFSLIGHPTFTYVLL